MTLVALSVNNGNIKSMLFHEQIASLESKAKAKQPYFIYIIIYITQ